MVRSMFGSSAWRGVTVGALSNGPRIMSSMFVYVDRPAVETSEMINDPDVAIVFGNSIS